MPPRPAWIPLGRIVGAHGRRGELKVQPEVDDLDTLVQVGEVKLAGRLRQIVAARWHKQVILLTLEDIATREEAAALRGEEITADPRRLPELPAGEFYWFELLGLPVLAAADRTPVGRLTQIIATGAHDVYVVAGDRGEYLVPAVADVVLDIDVEHGWIVVDMANLVESPGAV